MLQVYNLDDYQPGLIRKTSESLALTNLTDVDLIQCYNAFQTDSISKECRICLQNTEDSHNVFTSPCKCTGSLKFVHEVCFITWLEKQFCSKSLREQKKLKDQGIECQICKHKLYLHFQLKKECLSCEQSNDKIKKDLRFFIMLLILMVMVLASLSFLMYFMNAKSVSSFGIQVMATAVLSSVLIFLLVALTTILYSLIINFCMSSKLKLQSYTGQRVTKAKNKRQVIPL